MIYVNVKCFLFSIFFLTTSCSTLVGNHISQANTKPQSCCPLIESSTPINFSAMKTCIKSADNLYDVFAVETVSGKPDRKIEIHLFKNSIGLTWLERCKGDGKIETIAVRDTAVAKLIGALDNKHFYQLCTGYNSTVSVMNLFEYKSQNRSVFTYSLEGSSLESVCDADKRKVYVASQIFNFLRTKQ